MIYLDSQFFSRGVLYFIELSLDFTVRYSFHKRNTLFHKNTLILNDLKILSWFREMNSWYIIFANCSMHVEET